MNLNILLKLQIQSLCSLHAHRDGTIAVMGFAQRINRRRSAVIVARLAWLKLYGKSTPGEPWRAYRPELRVT